MPELQDYSEYDNYDSGPDIRSHLFNDQPFYKTRQTVNNVLESLEQKTPGTITVPRLLSKDEIASLPIGSVVTFKTGETVIEILDKKNPVHSLLIFSLKTKLKN